MQFLLGSGTLLQLVAIKTALFPLVIKGLVIMDLVFSLVGDKNTPGCCRWFTLLLVWKKKVEFYTFWFSQALLHTRYCGEV